MLSCSFTRSWWYTAGYSGPLARKLDATLHLHLPSHRVDALLQAVQISFALEQCCTRRNRLFACTCAPQENLLLQLLLQSTHPAHPAHCTHCTQRTIPSAPYPAYPAHSAHPSYSAHPLTVPRAPSAPSAAHPAQSMPDGIWSHGLPHWDICVPILIWDDYWWPPWVGWHPWHPWSNGWFWELWW